MGCGFLSGRLLFLEGFVRLILVRGLLFRGFGLGIAPTARRCRPTVAVERRLNLLIGLVDFCGLLLGFALQSRVGGEPVGMPHHEQVAVGLSYLLAGGAGGQFKNSVALVYVIHRVPPSGALSEVSPVHKARKR
jgi:hypothetical protein